MAAPKKSAPAAPPRKPPTKPTTQAKPATRVSTTPISKPVPKGMDTQVAKLQMARNKMFNADLVARAAGKLSQVTTARPGKPSRIVDQEPQIPPREKPATAQPTNAKRFSDALAKATQPPSGPRKPGVPTSEEKYIARVARTTDQMGMGAKTGRLLGEAAVAVGRSKRMIQAGANELFAPTVQELGRVANRVVGPNPRKVQQANKEARDAAAYLAARNRASAAGYPTATAEKLQQAALDTHAQAQLDFVQANMRQSVGAALKTKRKPKAKPGAGG